MGGVIHTLHYSSHVLYESDNADLAPSLHTETDQLPVNKGKFSCLQLSNTSIAITRAILHYTIFVQFHSF